MRLVTTSSGIGRLTGAAEVELLDTPFPDLGAALQSGVRLAELSGRPVLRRCGLAETTILAPVPAPPHLWAVGLNYASHAQEIKGPELTEPFIFPKATSAVTGPGSAVRLPTVSPDAVDYEGEVALVMGRQARHVSPADAWSYVAGITACNDVSARDVQKGGTGVRPNISMAKSFDTFAPLGPALTAPSDVPDPDDIGLRTWVNGELRQEARTSRMLFDVGQLIAFLSARVTLVPGDVIATGTPEGVGDATGRFLKPGDVVRIEVEHVGVLESPVQPE
jgi:2-keto-4-pentenoate hydratase/2-oxohepta-3-ene-1,7-dioic acid hydratase in catechol pathway